ncbi:MAG TPA: cytochrome c [Burkholderiaceae bacterium]|nr:cytochrome c [Burkholderiaceae bacterium]
MKSIAKSLLALLAAAALASSVAANEAKPAAKADPAKGQVTAQVCSACHAIDGSRGVSANPILQGQHADYLVKQLTEFKSGKRDNAVMKGMATPLSDEDMKNVAAFFASKSMPAGAAKTKDLVLLGEKIYRGGVADRSIPACSGCHGPNGAGIPAQYPRLAGQHAEYTEAQLKAFRDGVRKNNPVMNGVAAKLNDREIKALADYIAGLH